MDTTFWVALFGMISAVFGGAFGLMRLKHKQNLEEQRHKNKLGLQLEAERAKNQQLYADKIDAQIESLKGLVTRVEGEIKMLRQQVENMRGEFAGLKQLRESLNRFIAEREKAMADYKSRLVKLENDMVMVKGPKNGTQN